ncbi:MAG: hypothetical protein B6D61_14710, partial [Bacteroidetes bacterium 4484_249]
IDDYLYLNGGNTESVKITGDLTVNTGNTLNIQDMDLVVDGTIDIVDGGKIKVYQAGNGGTLLNNSDFELNGELDVGNGEVTVTAGFTLKPTGILTIDGGTFFRDQESQPSASYLEGTFNLYDGIFDHTNNGYYWDCVSSTITGGIIKCRSALLLESGDFHPTGGSVEFYGYYNSLVYCLGDNYFWDFVVNRTGNSLYLYTDLYIKNDFIVNTGWVDCQQPVK